MKKIFFPLMCLLLLAFVSSTGAKTNSYILGGGAWNAGLATDSDVFAIWNFENDLTDDGSNSENLSYDVEPSYSTETKKVGGCAVDIDSGDDLYRTDANLNASFPLKDGGTETFTVCGWMNWQTLPSDVTQGAALFSKWISDTDQSFIFALYNNYDGGNDFEWRVYIGVNGGADSDANSPFIHGTTGADIVSTGTWYYACASTDGSDVYIKLRNADGTTIGSDYSGAIAGTFATGGADVEIGHFSGLWDMQGFLDQVVVFDRVVSAADVTKLAKGTY